MSEPPNTDESSTETSQETILKPNPDLTKLIVALAESTLENNPTAETDFVVYQVTKNVLSNPKFRPLTQSVIPATFVYYLEAYKTVYKNKTTEEISNTVYLNRAVLSIFDLFLMDIKNHITRQLLLYAVKAIHEVVVAAISRNEDVPMQAALSRLSNLALLVQTVGYYTSNTRRKKNITYITWLKGFLGNCLESNDLTFIEEDATTKLVIYQVTNQHPVITPTTMIH